MNMKLALASATALGLLMGGAALADSNKAYITQSGDLNSAEVDQTPGSDNEAGLAADPMLQSGNGNVLTVNQTGDRNRVGTGVAATGGTGLEQLGGANQAAIVQTQNDNHVNRLIQNGRSDASVTQSGGNGNVVTSIRQYIPNDGGLTGFVNTLTINQSGEGNRIGSAANANLANRANTDVAIDQMHRTTPATVPSLGLNVIEIEQTGQYNRLIAVDQQGSNQLVDIRMAGDRNYVGSVRQLGIYDSSSVIRLDIEGNHNGAGAGAAAGTGLGASYRVIGSFTAGSFAAQVGIGASHVVQIAGSDNSISYTVIGNDNQFAFRQVGYATGGAGDNVIGGTATGNGNQIAIQQTGSGNTAQFEQTGNSNNAGIDVLGDDNVTNVYQVGNGNRTGVRVTGNGNGLLIDLDGNDNGTGSFSGVAAGIGLTPALTVQLGDGNSLTYQAVGNSNLFAFEQRGDGNTISGNVVGSNNQVAILQNGGNNYAFTQQLGANNNIGISQ